jgi:hypothetical protein
MNFVLGSSRKESVSVLPPRSDFGDGKPVRTFVCTSPNPWNYPAKDRAGRLEQVEEPHLGKLIDKLTRPGKRMPFIVSPREQQLKAAE